ncbi:hypothetical protein BST95_04835 [Halioglobus japonicus]|uniref:Mechanosensitive channel MscK n=1 Tax=Halioglobus japonicus TaxID=930805 RepID=A0AAP8SMI4_9GAMM|nr:mechanosensitive ion channel domain-containing protein [Halioglobus japonicus]AQA17662.1 hypothetical protein BST95_04835 [Halioglobus japonicus]PLW85607.1 hypothetical protein C0029_13400 [Halioglobus japonicus]GHD16515.1 hypothetical protein GCM10007052_22040 [Halioglobus japonicus]
MTRLQWSFAHLVFLCLLAISVNAQQTSEPAPITQDKLTALIDQVNLDTALGDEAKTQFTTQLEAAQQQLRDAQSNTEQAEQLNALAKSAPEEAERLKRALDALRSEATDSDSLVPADATLEQLESEVTLLEASRSSLAQRRDELRTELDEWPQQRENIQNRLTELKGLLTQNAAAPNMTGDTLEERVKNALRSARDQALHAEQHRLQVDLLTRPARMEIGSAESAKVSYDLEVADQELAALRTAAESARSKAAEEEVVTTTELEEQISSLAPQLREFAAHNRVLAERAREHALDNDEAVSKGDAIKRQLESMESDYSLMKRRLDVAGRKEILGRVMIQMLESLPNIDSIRRQVRNNNDRVANLSLYYIDYDEELRKIIGSRDYNSEILATLSPDDTESRELVIQMIDQRRQLVESNLNSLRDLIQNLLNNNESASNLILVANDFQRFLVGNLMWVRNFNFIGAGALINQMASVSSVDDWLNLPGVLLRGYQIHDWGSVLLALLFAVIALHRPLKSIYNGRLAQPALLNAETLSNILLCLCLVALLVLPIPLAVYIASAFLYQLPQTSSLYEALAPALQFVAVGLYALLLVKELLSPMGIGRRFLKWDARMLEVLRKELRWSGPLILIALLVETIMLKLDSASSGGPLGATSTAAVATTIITISLRLLRDPLFHDNRNLRVFLRLMILLPAITLGMLTLGLLFAAKIYLDAIILSIVLVFAVKIFNDIFERALLILRARLERKAKEELRAREEDGDETDLEIDDLVDVESLSEAHDKLLMLIRFVALGTGLWIIWSPSLPGSILLDSVGLWQVDDPADPTGALRTVTLMDLVVGIFILVVTALVAKHLPSLVTLFLLEWVDVSASARYASSIIMQYTVVAIGVSMFLATVGWDWSQLQWLVAALGVGIGFGLQEIVANFISGLIVLFERPVRVGDIISVGGAEGTVKSINARATVLQTFEGKEHLIPNKELITTPVINWSLSESNVRVVIPVGVAYGTDVRKAMDLMLEAAREVPLVQTEPEPTATFEDFGDNSLLLWLRCYVPEERPRAWTELRTIINDKFNAAGIVISFPQRDVHLDTLKPLEIRLAKETS